MSVILNQSIIVLAISFLPSCGNPSILDEASCHSGAQIYVGDSIFSISVPVDTQEQFINDLNSFSTESNMLFFIDHQPMDTVGKSREYLVVNLCNRSTMIHLDNSEDPSIFKVRIAASGSRGQFEHVRDSFVARFRQ